MKFELAIIRHPLRTTFDAIIGAMSFVVALGGFFAPELTMMMAN